MKKIDTNISSKIILAIECSAGSVSACIFQQKVIAEIYAEIPFGQAKYLLQVLNSVINSSEIDKEQIDIVAFSTGPGFYSAMRIGGATALGLSMGLNATLLGINTMEAMVIQNAQTEGYTLVIMETRRKDFFVQMFKNKTAIGHIKCLSVHEICAILKTQKTQIIGSGSTRFVSEIPKSEKLEFENYINIECKIDTLIYPTATSIARCVSAKLKSNDAMPTDLLYMRDAVVN